MKKLILLGASLFVGALLTGAILGFIVFRLTEEEVAESPAVSSTAETVEVSFEFTVTK